MPLPLLALAALAAQGYGIYQQHKASDKNEEYLDEQKKTQKHSEADARKSAYRASVSSALGHRAPGYMRPIEQPEIPDTYPEQQRAAIGQYGAQLFQNQDLQKYLDSIMRYYKQQGPYQPRTDVPADQGSWDMPNSVNT